MLHGIHLEGPFFSQERRGAQNAAFIIEADYSMLKRWNEASGKTVKLIAAAPEIGKNLEFIKSASGICKVSLAHSTASYETAMTAFSNGANHVTHLFNGMNPLNHREPGIIGAAYDTGVYAELITDGIHIHPSVVRAVFKLFGDDKVCLISDSMRACGLTDGEYELGGQRVKVEGRTVTALENNVLAGSATTLADCMRQAVKYGVPLPSALKAATINPAKSVGIDENIGSITIGKRANILIREKDLRFKQTIFNGVKLVDTQK
jgi:N-acetylglucosamine-6-phosphate deacetylase